MTNHIPVFNAVGVFQIFTVVNSAFLPPIGSDSETHLSNNTIPAEPLNPSEFEEAKLLEDDHAPRSSVFYEGEALYENSFRREQERQRQAELSRNGLIDERKRWPKVGENVMIPYIISSKFNPKQRQQIARAFDNFHDTTCLRFVPRNTQNDYIHIVQGNGCDSDAGRIGGEQTLSLGPGCEFTDIAIHELNHAVGFWHEQNRPDRDSYVNIYLNNVKPENRFNFDKMSMRQVNSYGVEYDTDSIMHYDKFAFSRDPQRLVVMEPKVPNENMGLAKVLSKSDILRILKMYKCDTISKKKRYRKVARSVSENGEGATKLADAEFHDANNCKDLHEDCSSFKSVTSCESNAWVKVTCRKSCNNCANSCQDMNAECSTWASKGACDDGHSEYMNLYCPKSCHFCKSHLN